MAQFLIPEEKWKELISLSDTAKSSRDALKDAWEKLAEEMNFVSTTVSVTDEEKGIIDAEARPSDEFIRQRRLLLVVDMLKGIPAEDVQLAAKLSTVESKLNLAEQLELVQQGADAADAIQAEPAEVTDYAAPDIDPTMDLGVGDNVIQLLKN